MKHRALSGAIVVSVGLTCGMFAACAGETIPDIDGPLADSIEERYAVGASGAVGAAGAGGRGQVASDADDDDGPVARAGRGGSASVAAAGAGGALDEGEGGAAGSAMVAAAGAAGGGVGGGGGSGVACDGFAIIQENCGGGSCHGQGSNLGTFAVSEDDLRSYIGEEGILCVGQGPLLDPADPEGSVLVQKLSDDPPCGQPMPAGVDQLDPEDIDCIVEYIGSLE